MVNLYCGLVVMLLLGMSLILLALGRNHIYQLRTLLYVIFFSCSTAGIYLLTSNQPALKQWQTSGKKHYALLAQVQELGGIQGMINKLEQRIAAEPNNAETWIILGKLYLANHNNTEAAAAFRHALSIDPNRSEARQYLKRPDLKNA